MNLPIVLREGAKMPYKKHRNDAGYDLFALDVGFDVDTQTYVVDTGVSVAIPTGYVGLVFPRSSIFRSRFRLSNSVGVIDSDYRGEIGLRFDERDIKWYQFLRTKPARYKKGERVAQLVIVKCETVNLEQVEKLPPTKRGKGGFGSTGKQ